MIDYVDVNCRSCASYENCRSIEVDYHGELNANKGNWREIYQVDGRRVGTPIRRCSWAILARHEGRFKDKRVLEVGCGPASEIDEKFCEKNNVDYLGIDPDRLPVKDAFPYLAGLPKRALNKVYRTLEKEYWKKFRLNKHQRYLRGTFPSSRLPRQGFDVIYGNSTIEHWHEDDSDLERSVLSYKEDIDECYHLLADGGVLLMNCPMFVHGNEIFIRGRVDLIETFFTNNWKKVEFERFRYDHNDLLPYAPVHRQVAFKKDYGIDLVNIWLLHVVASK